MNFMNSDCMHRGFAGGCLLFCPPFFCAYMPHNRLPFCPPHEEPFPMLTPVCSHPTTAAPTLPTPLTSASRTWATVGPALQHREGLSLRAIRVMKLVRGIHHPAPPHIAHIRQVMVFLSFFDFIHVRGSWGSSFSAEPRLRVQQT